MSKMKEAIMSNDSTIPPEFEAPGDYYAAMEEMSYYDAINRAAEMMMMYGRPRVIKDLEARYTMLESLIHGRH